MSNDLLTCGHPPTPQPAGSVTTGYASLADGTGKVCYDCAHKREIADLETAPTYMAYLKIAAVLTDKQNRIVGHTTSGSTLTSWHGGILARVIYLTRSRHNIGGYLYRGQAVTPGGRVYLFTSPGDGMYARMRFSQRQTDLWRRKYPRREQ